TLLSFNPLMGFESSLEPYELVRFGAWDRTKILGEDKLLAHLTEHGCSCICVATLNEFDQRGECFFGFSSNEPNRDRSADDRYVYFIAGSIGDSLCNLMDPFSRREADLIRIARIEQGVHLGGQGLIQGLSLFFSHSLPSPVNQKCNRYCSNRL